MLCSLHYPYFIWLIRWMHRNACKHTVQRRGVSSPQSQCFLDLRDGMQYRLYGWEHGVVWSNGSGDPNETRSRHGILVQSTVFHSLRPFSSGLHKHGCHKRGIFPAGEAPASPTKRIQSSLAARTTLGRVVSTIVVSTIVVSFICCWLGVSRTGIAGGVGG